MKAILLSLIFCLGCVSQSLAQVTETESQKNIQELYDFHFNKKRTNTAIGFITLGGGLAMVAGGITAGLNNCIFGGCNDGEALTIIGGITSLSSVYFFSNAGRHKKLANIQLQKGAIGLNNEFKYS